MFGIFAKANYRVSFSLSHVLVIFREEVKYNQKDSDFLPLHWVSTCVCVALGLHYSLGRVTVAMMLPVLYTLKSRIFGMDAKQCLPCLSLNYSFIPY